MDNFVWFIVTILIFAIVLDFLADMLQMVFKTFNGPSDK